IGASDRRAGCDGQTLTDRAAGQRKVIVRLRAGGEVGDAENGRAGLFGDDGARRKVMADYLTGGEHVERSLRQFGLLEPDPALRLRRRADRLRHRFERRNFILMRRSEMQDAAALRRAPTRLAGIGEEGDRRPRADQDEELRLLEEIDDLLGEIGDALQRDETGAALEPGGEGVAGETRTGSGRDPPGRLQPASPQRRAAEQERYALAGAQRLSDLIDRSLRDR